MKADDMFTACQDIVNTYLMARVYAELKHEEVDKIQREILQRKPVRLAEEWKERRMETPEQIIEPKHVYLGTDEDCEEFYAECNRIERERGVKPDDMPDTHCPALVAESMRIDAENCLIEISWKVINDGDGYKYMYGEDRKNWIDLICKLVINHPDYKEPKL